MGAYIKTVDTLRIAKYHGFPLELNYKKHASNPYLMGNFVEERSFMGKHGIFIYKIPPLENFLVEDIHGKLVYWGRCQIIEIKHDYEKLHTAGKFRITYINTPEEMKNDWRIIGIDPEESLF